MQKNTGQPDWGKIFVVDEQGLRPYAILPRYLSEVSSFYNLALPSVSSDGKVVAYAGTTDCPFAVRQCADFPFTRTIITGVPGKGFVRRICG